MPRKAMSWTMFWLRPESAEPIRKTTMANWNRPLRPNWSDSLPYSGVEMVEVNR